MIIKRKILEKFLKEFLLKDKVKDVALNGLQIEGKENIKKIALGVSANYEFFKKAIDLKADALITHHGIFWGKQVPIKGYFKERIKILLENDINLFAYHLPLDKNETIGNNISLAKLLKLKEIKPFGNYKETNIGFMGKLSKPMTVKEIEKILGKELSSDPKTLNFNKKKISKLAIVSGGAPDMIEDAITNDADLFITGEITEYIQEICRESKINYMHLGHYNSEKLGIQNLGKILEKKFKIKTTFIDIPNKA